MKEAQDQKYFYVGKRLKLLKLLQMNPVILKFVGRLPRYCHEG